MRPQNTGENLLRESGMVIAQVIKAEPIGWICALIGFFSGFTSINIYLGLSFLALGIFTIRFTRNARLEVRE